jgi:hypothetical protein
MTDQATAKRPRLSIGSLFAFGDEELEKLEASDELKEAQSQLDGHRSRVKPSRATEKVKEELDELMDVDIYEDVLINVWNNARLFEKYLDPEKYSASETIEVTLKKHTVDSVHKPYVEILFGDRPIKRITFVITVALHLEAAIVSVRNGRILRLKPGTCTASAKVTLGGAKIIERKSSPLALGPMVSFEDGIKILGRGAEAE